MNYLTHTTCALGAVLALAGTAQGQELAQSILDQYAADLTASGMSVSPGATATSAKTVEWTDVVFTGPEGLSYTMAFIRAEEIGGDKVRLSYPESFDLSFDAEGEQPAMDMTIDMGGVDHVVSGPAEARRHDMTAERIDLEMKAADGSLLMTIGLSDVVSDTVRSGSSDVPHYAGTMKAAAMSLDQKASEDDSTIDMSMAYRNVAVEVDLDAVSEETMGELLNGDRNFAISYSSDSSEGRLDIDSDDFKGTVKLSSGLGTAELGMADGMMNIESSGRDAKYALKMAEMALPPFEAAMETMGMTFAMPLKKTDATVPAAVKLSIGGLKVSDTVWGMVDPGGSIPRDAANLNIDLTAQMKWLVDVMTAAGAKAPPIEVETVAINDLTLEIGGAALNGSGTAKIDNSTMPPMPIGVVNLDLKGGLGLVDKLVGIGLVPAPQAQMIKGMAGVFTVPGNDGPDHLTSKIEMQEGGAILANGQRVK